MGRYRVAGLMVLSWATSVMAEPAPASRQAADVEFHQRLESLAAKCAELQLAEQARATREWIITRDPARQYLFLSPSARDPSPPADAPELVQKWHARFLEYRRAYAAQLFDLARHEASHGSATKAFQYVYEVLYQDPEHADAKRILRAVSSVDEESRPRGRVARLPHPQLGWARGRWWQIESPHFQISTNHSAEAGLELARRLEPFLVLWQQLFFDYWNSPVWLQEQFAGESLRPRSLRKHQVVLFRDRQDYAQQLAQIEPQIGLTLGYYSKGRRTSYFYEGEDDLLPVWYHEAAHQLFQERSDAIADVGEKANFWALEGVAVYLESLVERNDYYTVGGFDADRLQFFRTRMLGGEPQMPVDELARLGRQDMQQHPDIRRLYTQAAGLTHFLMDFDQGRYRSAFIKYLTEIYHGKDSPASFASIGNPSSAESQQEWMDFLRVREPDLQHLGPARRRHNLSLMKAEISNDSLAGLQGSDELVWLDLSFTPVTDAGLTHLVPLSGLRRLTLVGTRISSAGAETLSRLTQLEELDVSGTGIDDEGLGHLARLQRLKTLRISHTRISDRGLSLLRELKELEELDVDETQVTGEALARLRQELPKLK